MNRTAGQPRPLLVLLSALALWFAPASLLWGQEPDGTPPLTEDQTAQLAEAKELNRQVVRLYETGKFRETIEPATRALNVVEKALGPDHPLTAAQLNDLAGMYLSLGDYTQAEPFIARALKIRERVLGPEHADTATSLNTLAALYAGLGDYAKCEPLFTRSLKIREKALGPEHPGTATSLDNLAGLYRTRGDFAQAELLQLRAFKIREKAVGPDHFEVAISRHNLGQLYESMGDYAKAEPQYLRSLSIREKVWGPKHPGTATSLSSLALLYQSMGAYAKAEPLHTRALQIREQALGPGHPDTARSLNNLGLLYLDLGDEAKAEPLFTRSLKIWEAVLGPENPDIGTSLNNLASLYESLGDHARAESLFTRALAITKKARGPEHPDTARGLTNLARLLRGRGDYLQAEPLSRQAVEGMLHLLENTALAQSERQQLAMASSLRHHWHNYVHLAVAAKGYEATAYQFLLASKGSVLTRQRLRLAMADDERLAPMFAELQQATTRLASLALKTPARQQQTAQQRQIEELSASKERLEQELSRASAPFRAARHRATAEEVRNALLAGTVLVDFAGFTAYTPADREKGIKETWERRLVAFMLSRNQAVKLLDLGPLAPLTEAITTWRASSFGAEADAQQAAQLLREKLWEPLEPHLAGAKIVFISPDGELNKLPLAALPGRKPGTYLIEDYALAVVPVPRELVLAAPPAPVRNAALGLLTLGDVNYERSAAPPQLAAGTSGALRAVTGDAPLRFKPLAGAAAETRAVGSAFGGAYPREEQRQLGGSEATEAAFRAAAPQHRFLHLATHGFFAPPTVRSALARASQNQSQQSERLLTNQSLVGYHPDLLSGLALAGANAPPAEGDDGILTAAEVTTLDLRRVELVALSACETGLGQSAGGEGLLGLQRAFQVAGAKNVVASLWKVDDAATQVLMTEFYANLWQKKLPPIEALRQAQLKMLVAYQPTAGKLRAGLADQPLDEAALAAARAKLKPGETPLPPFYWAAFVLSGAGK